MYIYTYLYILLFQAVMTPFYCPKDTCFSDLLRTARSVDNGGLRLYAQ